VHVPAMHANASKGGSQATAHHPHHPSPLALYTSCTAELIALVGQISFVKLSLSATATQPTVRPLLELLSRFGPHAIPPRSASNREDPPFRLNSS
jgi:hypothetical protein